MGCNMFVSPCDERHDIVESKRLESSGYAIDDVIQSRLYLTEIEEWQQVARIHGHYFRDSRPAFTLLHVLPFPEKKMKVAIDIVAKKRQGAINE